MSQKCISGEWTMYSGAWRHHARCEETPVKDSVFCARHRQEALERVQQHLKPGPTVKVRAWRRGAGPMLGSV